MVHSDTAEGKYFKMKRSKTAISKMKKKKKKKKKKKNIIYLLKTITRCTNNQHSKIERLGLGLCPG